MDAFIHRLLSLLPPQAFPLTTMVPSPYQALAGLLTLQTVFGSPVAAPQYATPPALAPGHIGAVASESDICSRIGTDLLKQGGNAADALVGTVACVGVIGMYHSGTCARHSSPIAPDMVLMRLQALVAVVS